MDKREIEELKASRRFDPRKVADWLDLFIKTTAVMAICWGTIRVLAPQWIELPMQVQANTLAIANLQRNVPEIIDFRGGVVVAESEVVRGQSITVSMVVRRNVSCDTVIRVRFFDHATNVFEAAHTYEVPAVKAPVSTTFSPFSLRVFIPNGLPAGEYSYLPEIIPVDCGIYGSTIAPMSEPFTVMER